MNIEDLTIKQARELASIFNGSEQKTEYPVGNNVIVRTVTMIFTGKLVKVTSTDLVLLECSWIPDTERYAKFVEEGAVKQCEPYPADLLVFVNRGALIDLCELKKGLPRSQK